MTELDQLYLDSTQPEECLFGRLGGARAGGRGHPVTQLGGPVHILWEEPSQWTVAANFCLKVRHTELKQNSLYNV